MTPKDKKKFFELLIGAAEVAQASLSEYAMALYWKLLERYELQEVDMAILAFFQNPDNKSFMPKPQEIIFHIEGNSDSKALIAWSKFDRAVRTVGPHKTVVFDDPIIHAVVFDMGGWIQFGTISDDEYRFKGNEFVRRYRAYSVKPPPTFPKKFIGIVQLHNESSEPDSIPEPVLIGNREAALKVLETGSDKTFEIHYGNTLLLESQTVT